MIDDIDRRILEFLQNNSRTPNAAVARDLGMAPSAIADRIRKLEERGVIRGYTARLEPQALGAGLLAFIFVQTDRGLHSGPIDEELAGVPEIQEVHHIAGEDCYLVKVRTADTATLGRLLRERLARIEGVHSTRTTIVLETTKETTELPLRAEESEQAQGSGTLEGGESQREAEAAEARKG